MPSITKISTTSECLTPRAGLTPFVNFLKKSEVCSELSLIYQDLCKSKKGIKLQRSFLTDFIIRVFVNPKYMAT